MNTIASILSINTSLSKGNDIDSLSENMANNNCYNKILCYIKDKSLSNQFMNTYQVKDIAYGVLS